MHVVDKPPTLSVIIDAGHLHTQGDRILEIVRRFGPPKTLGGSYAMRGFVRLAAFWLPIIAALPSIVRRLAPAASGPTAIRTFVFDALYSPGATGLTATSGERNLRNPDELACDSAERAFVYWFAPTPLFGDPKAAAGHGPSDPLLSGMLTTDDGEVEFSFCVPMNDGLIHVGATNYDRPGLHLGYLSADDRDKRGITQKEVDTMIALAMGLEAQRGSTVIYIGADTDLLPAAQYASQHSKVFVCPLTNVPMRWRQMQKLAPDIAMHPLPVILPVFNSWSLKDQERARAEASTALDVPRDRVKLVEFDTPTIVDADFVRLLRAWEPEAVKLNEKLSLPTTD